MEMKIFKFFFKRVLVEKQSHVCLAALPTDSKRRWYGLFSCAGRIKFVNPAVPPPKPLYLWDLEEPKSSTGKPDPGSAFHGRSSPPGDGVSLGASSPENRTAGFHLLFLLATLCCLHGVGMGWLSHSSHTSKGDLPCMVPRCAHLIL